MRKMVCVCDKVVCHQDVCERWCDKDGVTKMVCDKVVCHQDVCERWCNKDVCEKTQFQPAFSPSVDSPCHP